GRDLRRDHARRGEPAARVRARARRREARRRGAAGARGRVDQRSDRRPAHRSGVGERGVLGRAGRGGEGRMTLTANRPPRAGLRIVDVPMRPTTPSTFAGFGRIVTSFANAAVDIVAWPVSGRRPLDAGTGVGGGVTTGPFKMRWKGDVLYADNHAVGGHYVTGWARAPEEASEERATVPRVRVLTHEANYHPDGGQIFFPRYGAPFVALLALPGDDVRPE